MQRLRYFARLAGKGLFSMGKLVWMIFVCMTCILGSFVVLDTFCAPDLPPIKSIRFLPHSEQAVLLFAHTDYDEPVDAEDAYQKLQPAMNILRAVCPAVTTWVEQRHEWGVLTYEKEALGRFACYRPATTELRVNRILFNLNNERRAVVLAHEYRHSRQGLLCGLQCQLATVLGQSRLDYTEDAAELFERQVYDAIRGR